jgi:Asp-tRNA(Asn)/Glu-tRNA(Gln) amidotransferase A subunit family amidase
MKNMSRRTLLKTAALATPIYLVERNGGAESIPQVKDDVAQLGAREAVEHIQKGDMKAEAYASQLLKRYNAHKDLNTVITIDEARVLQEARAIDQARARGQKLGPLAGLPFIVKDQITVAGYPATAGHELLKGYVPKQSATVVDTMVKAGGVVFAKGNCNTMVGSIGGNVTSSNPFFGFVRNPYDPTRIPGGSSGGTGAALAARIVPAGLGEDTGGSVRLPATLCGIAGLRPSTFTLENAIEGTTRKRYADLGIIPTPWLLETIGPMARTVSDVAFLDSVITGETIPQVSLAGVRIGIPRPDYWEARVFDPGVERNMRDSFSKLREAGAQLVEVDFNTLLSLETELTPGLVRPGGGTSLADWLAANAPGVTVEAINRLRNSYPANNPFPNPNPPQPLSPEQRKQVLLKGLNLYKTTFQANNIVALACPGVPCPAPLINVNGDTPGQKIRVNGQWVDEASYIWSMTFWSARVGSPSLSIPSGLISGLPVGLLMTAASGADAQLLGLGIAVEKVLGTIPPPKGF